MKRQYQPTPALKWTLRMILLTIAIIGCEEAPILEVGPKPKQNLVITTRSDILGTWLQWPLKDYGRAERTLTFGAGAGSLVYPNRTGQCGGQPELYKQFEWVDKGDGSLKLRIIQHTECGVVQHSGYEETAPYIQQGKTLLIFSKTWVRPGTDDIHGPIL